MTAYYNSFHTEERLLLPKIIYWEFPFSDIILKQHAALNCILSVKQILPELLITAILDVFGIYINI